MKKITRKNQLIVTALAAVIAIAGYLNYSGRIFQNQATDTELVSQDLLDISQEDLDVAGQVTKQEQEDEQQDADDGTPGEAVLTGKDEEDMIAKAKINREQVRSQNREVLQSVIENKELSDSQKTDAVGQLAQMTSLAEQEAEAETLLQAKGFQEVIVSLTKDSADVMVKSDELTDANRAQIEDIVMRKTKVPAEKIVITPIHL